MSGSNRSLRFLHPLLAGTGVALASLTIWREAVFAPHLIESADLLQPLSMQALRTLFWPFWNRIFEFPNVETAGRLAWMAPFLLLHDAHLAQRWMIATVVVAAAWSMLFAARRLGSRWLLASIAAILYATTPWAAIRLQHYFLLPGYAVLPALLALWLHPLRRGTAWVQALLLTFAACTPHYLAFAWGLSLAWLLLYPSRPHLRAFLATLLRFFALCAIWLVPTALFAVRATLVPSLPTWEMADTFSRNATLPSVARLDGYWWPLAQVSSAGWLDLFGWGLLGAAVLGAFRVRLGRRLLVLACLAFGAIALGTQIPWLLSALTLQGPLAQRLGWLFRDPNKAVGPLAAVLFLLAIAVPASRRWPRLGAAQLGLLLAYGAFALPWTSSYLHTVYQAHQPPPAFERVNAWLRDRPGRVLWVPRYFGARALWNGNNLTPEVAEYSSRPPALDSYGYDPRARSAFQALYFDVLVGSVHTSVPQTLRLWGARWLVHHRDLAPSRTQPPGTHDNHVEHLTAALEGGDLTRVLHDSPLYVYDAGLPVTPFIAAAPLASQHALAATLTLQNFGPAPTGWAFTERAHPGIRGVALLPGDDARLLLAGTVHTVDLASATVHYDPDKRWSRLSEADPEWDAHAVAAGLPGGSNAVVLLTRAPDATLRVAAPVPVGRYRVLLRAYHGPDAGAVAVAIGGEPSIVLDTEEVLTRSVWHDLGSFTLDRSASVTITNLDGLNIVASLALVPTNEWTRAAHAAQTTPTAWLWPSSALCGTSPRAAGVTDLTLTATVRTLPLQLAAADAAPWRAYDALRLELLGDGSGSTVEVWTRAGDAWVLVGTVRLWWRGWRSVRLPVVPLNFASAPGGTDNPADLVRILPPAGSEGAIWVRSAELVVDTTCALSLEAASDTPAVLRLASDGDPLTLRLNGEDLRVADSGSATIALRAGPNRIEVPRDRLASLRAVMVSTVDLDPAAAGESMPDAISPTATPLARRSVLHCSKEWRLAVTDAMFVPGLQARVGTVPLYTVPVDHLLLGAWVPPRVCGTLRVDNPWAKVGLMSAWASLAMLLALATLDVLSLRRRAARSRQGGAT